MEVLLAVSRQGSFGRAATELVVSQPAVSERIRNLERLVGRQLVERSTRGAALTPAGERLAAYASRCLALVAEAVEAVREGDGVPRFVLAGHATFAQRIVPLVFGALAELPRRLELRDGHSNEVLAMVQDEVADLGVTMASSVPAGLRRVLLPADAVIGVVAPDHPLARRRRIVPASLAETVLAVNDWGDGAAPALRHLTGSVEAWRVRRCVDAPTAVALARDHGHVAFVSGSSAEPDLRRGSLQRVVVAGTPAWTVRTQVVHRAARREDPAVVAVVRAVQALAPG